MDHFRFFDPRYGILSITGYGGRGALYQTSDGGRSWRLVGETSLDDSVDAGLKYPPSPPPLHASLWRQNNGSYSSNGLVRVVESSDSQRYLIQRLRVDPRRPGDDEWETISTLESSYVVKNGKLQPFVQR